MTILYPVFTAVTSIVCLLLSYSFQSRALDDKVVMFWGNLSCRMFGVYVKVQGLENLPPGKGAVLLFNHTSFFDIFAMLSVIPGLRFGAKIELFKLPFFGAAMRQMGNLPIDRARKEAVFKIYEEAQTRIQNGERFGLAPEGGRMETEALAPFKSGPFIFAINAQAPMVPVIVRGAARILPKNGVVPNRHHWRSEVEFILLPAVETKGFTLDHRIQLQEKVFAMMKPYLTAFQN